MLKFLKNWRHNATHHCDPLELEQAATRLVIGTLFSIYLAFTYHNVAVIPHKEMIGIYCLIAFELATLILLIVVSMAKQKSRWRRLAGNWLDVIGTSTFLSLSGDVGTVLIGVYLWITFGNGFRFGKKYLFHSQIISIIGFLIATQINPYWQDHQGIVIGFLVILIALPLYVAKLIQRINEARQKAEVESARAAEANLAKTRFVANMSHEIRTPLNGIIGISTLFKTTPLNADQKDLLSTLESSSKLLLSLLNNVLDFTKIEERKFTLESVSFSLEETVHDTLEIFRSQSNAKGVQIGASISNTSMNLKGDAFVIRQVLANLMGNAVKFTEQGSVTLSATIMDDMQDRVNVRFEVTDTGIGIPLDKQNKIFDSFTQADTSTTRKFGGSGLGLTIAKHMIEAMGSNLQFQSTPGVGSRFWFEVALEKDIPDASVNEAMGVIEPLSKARGIQLAKPLEILVCEDEGTNQKIITRLLSLPGHHVEIVADGDEMLDALEAKKFDLVISDLNMAGMSGTDALKLYRFTQPDDHSTRFILFTADATLSARQAATEAGFDAFLTKPVDAATLYSTIEKILDLAPNTAAMWMNSALSSAEPAPENAKESLAVTAPLDLPTLRELEKIGVGDDLFMHRLLGNYLSDSIKLIQKIESAVMQKRLGELHDHCHALKGNSLSVGALKLASTVETISKLSNTNLQQQSTTLLQSLNLDYAQLTAAIEQYLAQPKTTSGQASDKSNKKSAGPN